MRRLFQGSALIVGLVAASPAQAQRVSADILIHQGPIAGHVVLGERYAPRPVVIYRPAPRIIVERHYAPRRIVVERFHRGRGYWRQHGFRRVTVYYDCNRDAYYDRYDDRYDDRSGGSYDQDRASGLREVAVYEQDGHYYRDDRDDRRDDRWNDDE